MVEMKASSLLLVLLALLVVPASAGDLTVFHQDYGALGGVPANVAVLNPDPPFTPQFAASYSGGAVQYTVSSSNSAGELVVGGLTPATRVTYAITMDLDRTTLDSAIIIRGPGIGISLIRLDTGVLRIRSYYNRADGTSTSSYVDVPGAVYPRPFVLNITYDGVNKQITTSSCGYAVTTPVGGKAVPNYEQLTGTILRFEPEPSAIGDMTFKLYGITETVPATGRVTAIGDPNLVSFGLDGPNGIGTWENSAALVTAAGGRYTIWVDVDGLSKYPQNVPTVQALRNQGYELGIHFSKRLTAIANPYALMDTEVAKVTALFGRRPTSWCSLQNADNGTFASYAYSTYGMIWRNGEMGVGEVPNVPNLYNDVWPWWDTATAAGITIRSFTHDTDVDPPLVYSISPGYFQAFLSRYQAKGMTITPFIDWYKVGANTHDATFTVHVDPTALLNFSAHTNGYPAFVATDVPSADGVRVYNVTGGMAPVTNTTGADSTLRFYVADGATYVVTSQPLGMPAADFTANVTNGTAPLTVVFTDTSTGSPTAWGWQFGDGSANATVQNPVHTFTTVGSYTVNLTASNAFGANATNRTITVTPGVVMPVANFTANVTNGTVPLTVQFTDTSIGEAITNRSWDFENDGTLDSAEQDPVHTYTTAGIFSVNLTVTNESGRNTTIRTDYIAVIEAVPPTPTPTDTETPMPTPNLTITETPTPDVTPMPTLTVTEAPTATITETPTPTSTPTADDTPPVTSTPASTPVPAPVANFSANVTSGSAPLTIAFTDASAGDGITAWRWDFENDGVTDAVTRNATHTFASAGTFSVNLTVTGAGGSDSEMKTGYITVTGPATPTSTATPTPSVNETPTQTPTLTITGTSSPTITPTVTTEPSLVPVPPSILMPADTDGDGRCDDVNGNGHADFADVVLFFNQMGWIAVHEPVALFDYNGNGRIDFADVVWLFNHL